MNTQIIKAAADRKTTEINTRTMTELALIKALNEKTCSSWWINLARSGN